MASSFKYYLSLLVVSLSTQLTLSISETNTTIYEILPQYGLPSGLLPDSVESYSLSSDGQLTVSLSQPCYIQFDYLVYYDVVISGKLSYGSISELKGVQVQRFYYLWFDVDEIRVDLPPSDLIYFKFGFVNKKFDVAQFQTVRSCSVDEVGKKCGGGDWKRGSQVRTPLDKVDILANE